MAIDPDPKTLDHDCKIWLYDKKPLYDLEWDPLEVWWQTPGTKNLKKLFGIQYQARKTNHWLQNHGCWNDSQQLEG